MSVKGRIWGIEQYNDIINLPHPESKKHARMSLENRAAQFSPFAALTGYEAAIKETARLTDKKVLLSDTEKTLLDEKIRILAESLEKEPVVTITYFVKDALKEGGRYDMVTCDVKRIDYYNQCIRLSDGEQIAVSDIVDMQGEIFDDLFL